MKKIIIGLLNIAFVLNASDDLTVEQKQKIMFDQLRVQAMPVCVSQDFMALHADEKSQVIEILKKFWFPGNQEYEKGKKYIKKIFCAIQASSDLKMSMKEVSVLETMFIVDFLRELQNAKQILQQMQQNLELKPNISFVSNFVQRIAYAYQLQQKFNLPAAQEANLDHWYQQRMERSFQVIQKALTEGKSIIFDSNQVLSECPPLAIEDQQMQKLIKLHIKTSKDVLQEELRKLDATPGEDLIKAMEELVRSFSK